MSARPGALQLAALALGVPLLFRPSGSVGAAGTGGPEMPTTALVLGDSGKVVDVRAGDRLALTLEENPGTGYRWALDPIDEDVVGLESMEYGLPSGTEIGRGGQRTWTFIARRPGTVTLQLKLWRPWEADASIVNRFTATVQVRD